MLTFLLENFEKENKEIKYCNNLTEEVEPAHLAYSSIPYTDSHCPLPCSEVTYQATYGAMTVYENDNDDRACKGTGMSELYFTFSSMTVDYYKEDLMLNLPAVVGAVGGSLGLFLGFSCYGVLSDIIDNWRGVGLFNK